MSQVYTSMQRPADIKILGYLVYSLPEYINLLIGIVYGGWNGQEPFLSRKEKTVTDYGLLQLFSYQVLTIDKEICLYRLLLSNGGSGN